MAQNNQAKDAAQAKESFEGSLAELEEIVSQLEAGAKPLDESLALYERGVSALKRCHAMLDKAEQRIRLLVRGENGEPQVVENHAVPTPAGKESSRRKNSKTASEDVQTANSGQSSVDESAPSGHNPPSLGKSAPAQRDPKSEAGGSLFGQSK